MFANRDGSCRSPQFSGPKKQDFDPALALSLLEVLHEKTLSDQKKLGQLALVMGEGGWLWTPFVLSALGHDISQANKAPQSKAAQGALAVWKNLPEWQDQAPLPPPNDASVSPIEARERLANLVGKDAENRPGQSDFASAVAAAVFEAPTPQTSHDYFWRRPARYWKDPWLSCPSKPLDGKK